jgi:KDO2-lipid IV(A) lauroyltransferase
MMEQTLGTRIALAIFGAIPLTVRKSFFVSLSLLFYYVHTRRRLITIHNLKCAYPEKSISEITEIAKGAYRNFGIVAAEFFDIPSLNRENLNNIIETEGLENCKKALEKNKGLLLFGAHFGNWELGASALSLLVRPIVIVYRRMDNPFLENVITWVRSVSGNILLSKSRAMRRLLRHLKDNGVLGILIDQNWSRQEGCFVHFFDRPACTTSGLALLALHTEAPVVPAFMARMPNGKYRLIIGEEVALTRTGDRQEEIIVNTQKFTRIIEDMIRKYPDQWFWPHQRWKTQPLIDTENTSAPEMPE